MEASIYRVKVSDLAAGSPGYWQAEKTDYWMERTSRREMLNVVKSTTNAMTSSVEDSMKMGANFPIQGIGFSSEASSTFRLTMEKSMMSSTERDFDYAEETVQ